MRAGPTAAGCATKPCPGKGEVVGRGYLWLFGEALHTTKSDARAPKSTPPTTTFFKLFFPCLRGSEEEEKDGEKRGSRARGGQRLVVDQSLLVRVSLLAQTVGKSELR